MAEEGAVIHCHSVDQWMQQFDYHEGSRKLVAVHFTASWCGPCRLMAPVFAELAKKMPHVTFVKVDVDEVKSVAKEHSVEAMPTFVFFKDGAVVNRIVGANNDKLIKGVEKYSEASATVSA